MKLATFVSPLLFALVLGSVHAQTLTWTKLAPTAVPSARFAHAMAYDSDRDRIVLFGGGISATGDSNDTWEFDGATWRQMKPTNSPSKRRHARMAYDPKRKRTVLFGGSIGYTTLLSDTWEWDGAKWTRAKPTTSPAARHTHAMFYDVVLGKVVLFSGWTGKPMNDIWSWNGEVWTQLSPKTSPPARANAMAAYDTEERRCVVFGGHTASKELDDTWVWDGSDWAEVQTTTQPSARDAASMVYARGAFYLFGGSRGWPKLSNETWRFDGKLWTLMNPTRSPSARWAHGAVFDPKRGQIVLFGGRESTPKMLSDMWCMPVAERSGWVKRTPAQSPSNRSGPALAYDSNRGRTVLFGGWLGRGPTAKPIQETWEWNGQTWTQVKPATQPPGRWHHAMTYDAARQRVVLFGGTSKDNSSSSWLGDTWEFDGKTWTNVTPKTNNPAPRILHAMAYDASRERVVMFGGNAYRNDTWEWDGKSWLQLTPKNSPAVRSGHGMVYDSLRERVVMFGGTRGPLPTSYYGDTWEFDGKNWVDRTPKTSIPKRWAHGMAFDKARGVAVVFGGYQDNKGGLYSDTWEWNGTTATWRQVPPASLPSKPSKRGFTQMVFDAARNRTLLFGGWDSKPQHLVDTWEYSAATPGFSVFGSGCAGTASPPALSSTTVPRIGRMFTLHIFNLKPLTNGLLVLGSSNTEWNGSQLPLGLSFMGMNGCKLLVSWEVTIGLFSQAGGTLQWSPTIPNENALVGRAAFAQAWVIDAAANPLGVATSNGARAQIGN